MSKVDKNLLATLDSEKYYDFMLSNKLQDDREIAETLVVLLEDEDASVAKHAENMLSLCRHSALFPVAKKLSPGQTTWNYLLISIAWSIALNSEYRDYRKILSDVIQYIMPILDDKSFPENVIDRYVEREYEQYRICDEVYLLVAYLDPDIDYNEMAFWDLDYEERTREITLLKSRLQRQLNLA